MSATNLREKTCVLLFLSLCIFSCLSPTALAQLACSTDEECAGAFKYPQSKCRNGFCSNPFEKGCLHTLLSQEQEKQEGESGKNSTRYHQLIRLLQHQIRVCNSEDPPEAAAMGLCLADSFNPNTNANINTNPGNDNDHHSLYSDYTEIRINSQNWESAYFASWLLQIVLSEILRVPTSIEAGVEDVQLNFYNPTNSFGYGISNDWPALENAFQAENADCRAVPKRKYLTDDDEEDENNYDYVPCGHVIMEFWNAALGDFGGQLEAGTMEAPEGLGATGEIALFIPKFTAEHDPTLMSIFGLQGEEQRRKLAETFKRPTTWLDYCQQVSPTNCTTPDHVAKRPPEGEHEYHKMHSSGVYTGYFRYTEENDCDKHPFTCTGHVADFPCGWTSYVVPQMYHHNIALKSSGSEPGSHGYTYGQITELWAAANETGNHLMSLWWTPEALYSTYLGTDTEMQKVALNPPTQECIDHRIKLTDRCGYETEAQRIGDKLGSCDEAPQMLTKIISSKLYPTTNAPHIPEAKKSPAYDTIKSFSMSDLQLGDILKAWTEIDTDRWAFDPRMATCEWALENLDVLETWVPRTYPRVAQEVDTYETRLFYAAVILGALALVMAIGASILTYRRRNGPVMRYAQVEFLLLLLLGLFLVSAGSLLLSTKPNDLSCVFLTWFVSLGYTLELVPLIVKVGAINKLMAAAKKSKRIILTREQLLGTVGLVTLLMIIFLIIWTVMDPQRKEGEFTLTEDISDYGESIVKVSYYCHSESDVWRYIAVAWHCILLICATVLAFQTRNLQTGFNESQVLAVMIYSHFVFVMLRVITFLLEGSLSQADLAGFRSIIYSTDAIVTILIYFVPKFRMKDEEFQAVKAAAASRNSQLIRSSLAGGGTAGTSNRSGLSGTNSQPEASPDAQNETSALQPKDPLKNKSSWAGFNLSSFASNNNNDASYHDSDDEDDDEDDDIAMPLTNEERPVDVLKESKNSWGGGTLSMFVRDDANGNSFNDGQNESEVDEEEEEDDNDTQPPTTLASIIAAKSSSTRATLPSLPAAFPSPEEQDYDSRLSYVRARISQVRALQLGLPVPSVEEVLQAKNEATRRERFTDEVTADTGSASCSQSESNNDDDAV